MIGPLFSTALALVSAQPAPTDAGAAKAPPQLRKGPVVQHVTEREATILWEMHKPGDSLVRYEVWGQPNTRSQIAVPGPQHLVHKVRLRGLRPATRYRYEVREGTTWHGGSFTTAGGDERAFSFLVYGDCRTRHDQHRAAVEAMMTEKAAFAVITGDLVGTGGRESHWQLFFDIERPLLRKLPVYPVLGNHELAGGINDGMRAFRRYFAVPEGGPQPGFVYSFRRGNSLFLVLNSNAGFSGSEQTAWAEHALKEAARNRRIRHIFAFLHHGPYASGPHGENLDVRISGLAHKMAAYGVDFVFSGHDHLYERGEKDGLRYVVSAGCGAPLYPMTKRNPYTQMLESTAHYVRVTVIGDEVELQPVRLDGSLIELVRYRKHFDGVGKPARFTKVVWKKGPPPRGGPAVAAPKPPAPKKKPAPGKDRGWVILVVAVLAVIIGLAGLFIGGRLRRSRG